MDRPQPFFGSGRSTSLSSPGSESEESKDDSSEFFPDFVAAMRHTPTPDPQQSINEKASVQDHTNGFENLKPSAKLIIDPSCRAKGVPAWPKAKARLEQLEVNFPDDQPYIVSYKDRVLTVTCQECDYDLKAEGAGIANIEKHAGSVLHAGYVEQRLRTLELRGFQRTFNDKIRERLAHMNSSSDSIAKLRKRRDQQYPQRQASTRKPSETKYFGSLIEEPDSEDEPLQLKRRRLISPSSTNFPANNFQPDIDKLNEALAQSQRFEKMFEELAGRINGRLISQHALLIEEVHKKISYNLQPLTNRVNVLEKRSQESEQSAAHKELFQQRMGKMWNNSEEARKQVKELEKKVKGLEKKFLCNPDYTKRVDKLEEDLKKFEGTMISNCQRVIDEVRKFEKELQAFTKGSPQRTIDRVDRLEAGAKTLAKQLSDLTGLVGKHEEPSRQTSTFSDSQISNLTLDVSTILDRLAILEQEKNRLISKIRELERN